MIASMTAMTNLSNGFGCVVNVCFVDVWVEAP